MRNSISKDIVSSKIILANQITAWSCVYQKSCAKLVQGESQGVMFYFSNYGYSTIGIKLCTREDARRMSHSISAEAPFRFFGHRLLAPLGGKSKWSFRRDAARHSSNTFSGTELDPNHGVYIIEIKETFTPLDSSPMFTYEVCV